MLDLWKIAIRVPKTTKMCWKVHMRSEGSCVTFHKHVPYCLAAATMKQAKFLAKSGAPPNTEILRIELVPSAD